MPDYPNPNYQQTPVDQDSENDSKENQEDNEIQGQSQQESKSTADIKTSDAESLDKEPTPDELSETIRKERPTKNNVSAFATKPRGSYFDSQLKNEEIALLLRRHPITQLSKICLIIGGLLFPAVMFASPFLQFMRPSYKIATLIGWYLILSGFALESFLVWFFNVFIITNRRVIDVDFYSMIHKDVSSAKLENIQDMSVVTQGFFASLIDFGTLYIQTAGQTARIEFEDIPHPSLVTKVLNELISKKKRIVGRGRSGL